MRRRHVLKVRNRSALSLSALSLVRWCLQLRPLFLLSFQWLTTNNTCFPGIGKHVGAKCATEEKKAHGMQVSAKISDCWNSSSASSTASKTSWKHGFLVCLPSTFGGSHKLRNFRKLSNTQSETHEPWERPYVPTVVVIEGTIYGP